MAQNKTGCIESRFMELADFFWLLLLEVFQGGEKFKNLDFRKYSTSKRIACQLFFQQNLMPVSLSFCSKAYKSPQKLY